MATETLYGTNYTAARITTPSDNVEAREAGGRVRVIWDTIEAAGGDAGSTYYLGSQQIPKGARVVDAWAACDDLGTGGQIDIKVGSSIIIDSIDVGSAATFTRITTSVSFVTTAASWVTAVSTDAAATGTIEVCVFYVID